MISTKIGPIRLGSCPVCSDRIDDKKSYWCKREVVKTSCHHPHYYHLDCIASKFDALPYHPRRCEVCGEQPLPLVRLSGLKHDEKSPYCEPYVLDVIRTGSTSLLQKLCKLFPQMLTQKFHSPTEHCDMPLLFLAVHYRQTECLQTLIDNGANERNQLDAALNFAARLGHTACISVLLNNGATSVNYALELAVKGGHDDCLNALIDNGVNNFDRAFYLAAYGGQVSGMDILLNRAPDIEPDQLNDYLNSAAHAGYPQILQLLIDNGANDLNRALRSAAIQGHSDCLQILISNGADDTEEALNSAVLGGHTECLELLIDNGASELNVAHILAEQFDHGECEQILREKITSQDQGCIIL